MTPSAGKNFQFKWIDRIAKIEADDWDSLARPLATPLLEYHWLDLLERSGSICPATGWQPCHLTVWHGNALVAAAPLYIKTHSEGEFIFDAPWVELAGSAGIRYYPKLVGMSPVSPVTGYRFLVDSRADEALVATLMLDEIEAFSRANGLGGCHFLFVDDTWQIPALSERFHPWHHPRFFWRNQNFGDFDDYLSVFSAGQRRNIRRERKSVAADGVTVVPVLGHEAPAAFFERMHAYYLRTNDKFGPWGCRYLTEAFFHGLAETCRDRLLFMAARKKGAGSDPVAMALFLAKGGRLLGRYWGTGQSIPGLHFEVCYYRPIAWAIENGFSLFDPGMGGEHKLRRGFRVSAAVGWHRFFDPRLHRVFGLAMTEINRRENQRMDEMNRMVPFARKN